MGELDSAGDPEDPPEDLDDSDDVGGTFALITRQDEKKKDNLALRAPEIESHFRGKILDDSRPPANIFSIYPNIPYSLNLSPAALIILH